VEWSNDYEYDTIFSRQLEGLGVPGDIPWGISTSGNSKNVVRAFQKAKEMRLKTIALTGQNGGAVGRIVDCLINVPATDTARVQESHIIAYHVICEMIDRIVGPVQL
jgi:D-sedoheptulose 7-phosphate isomerase